jgi:hypothetical protein
MMNKTDLSVQRLLLDDMTIETRQIIGFLLSVFGATESRFDTRLFVIQTIHRHALPKCQTQGAISS